MKTEIIMPQMGESITEGTIIKWHKKVGDKVKKDEIIYEITTDKVDTEIPSPCDGTLVEIRVKENEVAKVGTVVAIIDSEENINSEIIEEMVEQEKENVNDLITDDNKQSIRFYSPAVLNIARQEDISLEELDKITGTGIKGRVTKKDLLDYIEKKKSIKEMPAEKIERKTTFESSPSSRVEVIPVDHIRERIIHNMIKSRDTSVHVTSIIEVDVTRIYNFINNNKEHYAKNGIKLTYLPFIAYAAIKALKEYPLMNATIEEDKIIFKKFINLGIAVAIEPDGLIVPNIKNADEMNIIGLAKAIADLSNKARTKKLLLDDITNGTFTITNYGVFGTLIGTPIINQPEVGILGVGSVTKKPVVIENNGVDSIAIRSMMYLSLSHDHRLIDGMLGGKFLSFIKNYLENFEDI
ncbi:dihydrolipoamide acetyltransferase family protein [Rosettibacter firmus]|uniref:dihydrolipoamide acetyltransferase family protein n=1 Tax=Rosettibacter firmus TaxID=3111522 RepID=UPI00336C1E92